MSNSGSANNTPWNMEPNSFAPNTNVMDEETMPSKQAEAARNKSDLVMEALRAGDTKKANELMGKDETQGRLLPGVGWMKKKLNKRK